MKNYKFIIFIFIAFSCSFTLSGQLIINELMQSNIDCIMDDLNEFPDSWVELQNAGKESESLGNYKISDKNNSKKAYKLPEIKIEPGSYILLFCDKEDSELHTDFRLESGKGCNLYLFKGDEVVDQIENLEKQPAPNIAYGRKTDGSDKWGWQAFPTPGSANCGFLCTEILNDPVFSSSGKITSDTFDLSISIPDDAPCGTIIRYTIDGKEPTELSPVYVDPIRIARNIVVRAKLFCDGFLSPRSVTHSYINLNRDVTLPVISIVTDEDYFYDDKIGIYVEGSYDTDKPNFNYDWRRPINLEYFESQNTESVINQLCETRVKGGATRIYGLKSLAVYSNKRFGTKRFVHEFFTDQTPGISEFKSFELRNAGNDFIYTYMRDAVIQKSMGMNADLDWQPSRPIILFVNGEYKGILNVRPRSNEDYVYSYYNKLEDIDLIENWSQLKEGSMDNFYEFSNFYSTKGHPYKDYLNYMDTEEFCNLMIMELFFDNKDFPGNNIVMWRPRSEGGLWRWIAKDLDCGLGYPHNQANYKTLNWITTPGYDNNYQGWANQEVFTCLFSNLLDTSEFKDMFINRCAIYMGDFLNYEKINQYIENHYNIIKDELNHYRPNNNLSKEVDFLKTWTRERWNFFYEHLSEFFNLNYPVGLKISQPESSDLQLIVNDITLINNEFNGKFYPGRRLIMKTLSKSNEKSLSGWQVKTTSHGLTTIETFMTECLNIEMPESDEVEIIPILSDDSLSIQETLENAKSNIHCEIYDLTGRYIGLYTSSSKTNIPAGIYIMRQDKTIQKIIIK